MTQLNPVGIIAAPIVWFLATCAAVAAIGVIYAALVAVAGVAGSRGAPKEEPSVEFKINATLAGWVLAAGVWLAAFAVFMAVTRRFGAPYPWEV